MSGASPDGLVGVSTHSRLKAAGAPKGVWFEFDDVSTHSRLKAAGGYSAN